MTLTDKHNLLQLRTPVEILVGNFKGLRGIISGYRTEDQSYLVKGDHIPDIRWRASELEPKPEVAQ